MREGRCRAKPQAIGEASRAVPRHGAQGWERSIAGVGDDPARCSAAELRFVESYPFSDLLEQQCCVGPADAPEQLVKRLGRTFAVQLHAVQPAREVEQMAVHLPPIASDAARPDPTSVRLKDHPRQCPQSSGHFFPSAGEGLGEDARVKLQIGHLQCSAARQPVAHFVAFGGQVVGVVLVDRRNDGNLIHDLQIKTAEDEGVRLLGIVRQQPHFGQT